MADVNALLAEADSAYQSGSWDAALESYKKALEADSSSAVACRRMADVLAIRGRFADVLDAYFRLIDILEGQGDLDGALEVANWVMNLKPDSDQARMKMIFAYHKKGDLKEVVRQSRELARLYIDLGQGDQSIALLQQAQKADPDNLDIGLELAEMYVSHGHIQDGANQYRKVANSFLDQGNTEKAAEAFRRMKVIVPDDPGVLLTLGNLYVDLKRYNEAEQEYRSILRHNLNHEEALLALGRVCQLKKQFRDAILAFNRILSINPDEVTAKEKLGELYQAQGLTSESIKNYLSAAQSYLEFEERDKAIRLFQIVLGLDPANPTACRELTNLGAPLVGIRNEELEPPEPAAPEKPEPSNEPDASERGAGRSGLRRNEDDGSKVRSGLLRPNEASPSSKMGGAKSGLLSSKPKLGEGKPALGSSGGPRKGLLRPGLASSGGDKPVLLRRGQEAADESMEEMAPEAPVARMAPVAAVAAAAVAFDAPPADDPFPGAVDPFARSSEGFADGGDPFSAGSSGDPFNEANNPFASSAVGDPFGSGEGSFGSGFGSEDPFAAGAAAAADPFANAAPSADPFAQAAADPFASTATADPFAGDPFAAAAPVGDPFAAGSGDPFASPAPAGDPFASASADPFTSGGEPFAAAPVADPFAAPAADPFGATPSADPFAASGGDPFASTSGDPFSAPAADPFGATPGADPFAAPAADPFASSAASDPFTPADPFASAPPSSAGFAPSESLFSSSSAGFAPSENPFGTTSVSMPSGEFPGGGDPFGAPAADPFAAASAAAPAGDPFTAPAADPFAASAPAADPFASPAAADPFGAPPADPFGAPASDPFGAAASDPFGAPPSDPFGAPAGGADLFSQPEPAGGDLFASAAPAGDPFSSFPSGESAPAADPFAAPPSNDLFSSPASPVEPFAGPASDDPFAAPAPVSDPFAQPAPVAGAVRLQPLALETQAADSPFDPFASEPAQISPSPVSDPFAAPAADLFAAPAAHDPFAAPAGNDPFASAGSGDPFGGSGAGDPFAAAAPAHDPFAAPPGGDPFGAAPAADLFAAPGVAQDPFAAGASDPFGKPASDPFSAPPAGDPFSTPISGDPFAAPAAHDPFASAPVSAQDPFAAPATQDPVAASQDLFAAAPTHDPFSVAPTQDPFAATPVAEAFTPPPAAQDPFGAVSDPFASAPSPSLDPFGAAPANDPFAAAPVSDPFASAEPLSVPTSDPFASAPTSDPFGSAAVSDPFAASEPFASAAVVDQDPFAASVSSSDPFAAAPAVEREPFGAAAPLEFSPLTLPQEGPPSGEPLPEPASFGGTLPSAGPVSPVAQADAFDPFTPPPALEPLVSLSADGGFDSPLTLPRENLSFTEGLELSPLPSVSSPAPSYGDSDLPFGAVPAHRSEPTQETVSAVQFEAPVAAVAVEPEPAPVLVPEPEPEPEPAPAPPAARPRASLSLEDESSPSHVQQAQRLREAHKDADVATLIRAYRKSIEDSPENLLLRAELADLHLRYGLLEDAVVQYRQILKRNPQSLGLHHRLIQAHLWNDSYDDAASTLMELANLHVERGEQHEALESLQSVLSLDPHHFQARRAMVDRFSALQDSKLAAHHLCQLAESALTKGNVEEAIPAFKQLMEISDDPSFEERLAQVYETQGDTQLALEHYGRLAARYRSQGLLNEAATVTERLVALAPEDLATRTELVDLYHQLGQGDKVLTQRYQLARFYHSQGQAQQALGLLEQVLAERPDHHEARRFLVDTYLETSLLEEALKHTGQLTQHYLDSSDHANAISLYTRLVDAQPDNANLRHSLIQFFELAGDAENAAEQWLFLAQLHSRQENWDGALAAYQKLLEIDDSRVEIHYQLALLNLEKLNNAAEAMKRFHRVYELNPGHTEAMSKYIRMLLKMGKSEGAAKVLQRLEQENPDGANVRKGVLADFRTRIEAEPSDLRARFVYGELCFHLGELDLAIEQFQQTRRDASFELKSYNMLGLCFAERSGTNMLDLAIRQFRKGLETQGHSEQEYLELRYNLAMLQYRNNRLQEALQELKDCYAVDIAYKDVREWVRRIEAEIAGGPKVARLFPREK